MVDWNLGNKFADRTDSCVLIILNQPLISFDSFKQLWENARYRICADGGANCLYDALKNNPSTDIDSYHSYLTCKKAQLLDLYRQKYAAIWIH